MKNTKIDWADHSYNPVTGCLNNCPYCYARRMVKRFKPNAEQEDTLCIVKTKKDGAYPHGFTPTLYEHRLDFPQTIKKPSNIFVCSMADLFGEWIPEEWIFKVLESCKEAPQHNYMFLTKNPQRYNELYLPYFKNFWFGYSITRPYYEDVFVNNFCNTFISIEPLLEDLDLNSQSAGSLPKTDWVIIGAESGRRKDKVIPKREWIEDIVKDCWLKGVPVYMKDSLIPIMGKDNIIKQFPWDLQK